MNAMRDCQAQIRSLRGPDKLDCLDSLKPRLNPLRCEDFPLFLLGGTVSHQRVRR